MSIFQLYARRPRPLILGKFPYLPYDEGHLVPAKYNKAPHQSREKFCSADFRHWMLVINVGVQSRLSFTMTISEALA